MLGFFEKSEAIKPLGTSPSLNCRTKKREPPFWSQLNLSFRKGYQNMAEVSLAGGVSIELVGVAIVGRVWSMGPKKLSSFLTVGEW